MQSDGFNAMSPTERRFEYIPVRSLSFLNGNTDLSFFTLHSGFDSLGRQCIASSLKCRDFFVSKYVRCDTALYTNRL